MSKIFHVAKREFIATVATKAFIFGVFLPPILMGAALTLMPMLMNKAAPKVFGRVAIVDRTGEVAPRVKEAFSPEKVAARAAERLNRNLDESPAPQAAKDLAKQNAEMMGGKAAQVSSTLTVETLAPDADLEKVKAEILATADKPKDSQGSNPLLALAVIDAPAIRPDAKGEFGSFQLFTAAKLDFEVQGDIRGQVGDAIVDARIAVNGFDPARIHALTERPRPEIKTVTAEGDKTFNDVAKLLIPGAFMLLLWISTFTCGQYLLTSTIEEKSSRVMEVILSAVSPMQLLTGKIIGQMCVGLVILTVYCGLGMGGLVVASMMSILDPMNLVYLLIYFVIAFFIIASLMAAVGSAVSDVREAQSLLGPIMIILVIPMMLWMPILRNPNSTFAQICSFIPPISPFVMILRLSGSEAVPLWQVPATILLGAGSILFSLWAAGKVFRVGVLMYGKPPNFKTLLQWVWMA
jgi:ABC-2 type transport system permease protein